VGCELQVLSWGGCMYVTGTAVGFAGTDTKKDYSFTSGQDIM